MSTTSSQARATTPSGPVNNPPSFFIFSPRISEPLRPKQNWVLDPFQDTLLIIAAPLLAAGLALLTMQHYGAAQGAVLIITTHIILTIAHHLPTFIRIYGDVDLFRRFKWHFVLGPVVPLVFAAGVLTYINMQQYRVEYFLYLWIFLSLWDPWHFLRQHFGFMRIYDRHNAAPRLLASRLDWAVSGFWFLHIMVASADWLPGLLADLYRSANIPLLLALPTGLVPVLHSLTWWLAVAATLVYGGYTLWCFRLGYFVSPAKIALLVCTFGVMYFTYTPNDWILQLVPEWSFKVGFATVGIVHMTQYLAIVWRYDRRIAEQGRARGGWFAWLHGRRSRLGIGAAALVYAAICIGYGDLLSTRFDNRWVMSCLLAVGFTSTLLHYYFDGFIWRMRHSQNREALGLQADTKADASPSWWDSARFASAGGVLLRQLLYFGVPMGVLTGGAVALWQQDSTSYVQQMYRAQELNQQGQADAAADMARRAYASMQAELPFAEKMADLRPSGSHEAQLAFLIYNHSLYRHLIMPALNGQTPTPDQRLSHAGETRRAANLLISALYRGDSPAHFGREQLTPEQALQVAQSWQRQTR